MKKVLRNGWPIIVFVGLLLLTLGVFLKNPKDYPVADVQVDQEGHPVPAVCEEFRFHEFEWLIETNQDLAEMTEWLVHNIQWSVACAQRDDTFLDDFRLWTNETYRSLDMLIQWLAPNKVDVYGGWQ